ncbi:hypothetical protein M3182_07640 [Mesobacillus maritimus]|uniref:hypothetical protein n=1 Tax=Mesobacillus maritimus TaxID=1643336 RepID=UPI00203CDA62|nr:hypothetical protein [Mesobacillus maritimus]MCM3585620.1 hypothetical protein [Mesobacillus maritimus]
MSDKSMKLKDLTRLVANYEKDLNDFIKDKLNDNQVVALANTEMEKHLKKVRFLRRFSEIIAHQFNFPTRDDLANVSRLVMQLEDRLDHIEEMLIQTLGENGSIMEEDLQTIEGEANQQMNREEADLKAGEGEGEKNSLRNRVLETLSQLGKQAVKDSIQDALSQRGNLRG